MTSALMDHRTEADVMSAALRAHGYPAYPYEEGGVTALAVPLNPTVSGDDVLSHPHVLIASGESADRPIAEHDEPWAASLHEPGHEFVDVVFAGDPAHGITEDARRCAAQVVDYASLWFTGHVPVPGSAQRLLDALRRADVAGFYDGEDGVVYAHPTHVPQDRALKGPHVMLQVFTASDGWPDGFSAVAFEPDGGVDFHEVATVFESRGVPGERLIARGATAVAEWFTEPRPSAGAELLRALAAYGIAPIAGDNVYAVSLDLETPADDQTVWSAGHLSIADRTGSTRHVPAAHCGWAVFRHDDSGEPVGDLLFGTPASQGRPDCSTDSANAAAFIADLLTAPASGL